MVSLCTCASPLGGITLAEADGALIGLWFDGQKHFLRGVGPDEGRIRQTTAVLEAAMRWLDDYFAGRPTGPLPPLAPRGTAFERRVWRRLQDIPRGQTVTYGQLAGELGSSARAVGGAVGRNPVSILIPCHRVVGADGRLTGYAGGLERKLALLKLEQV